MARHATPHRWNQRTDPDGTHWICRGMHERSAACEWELLTAASAPAGDAGKVESCCVYFAREQKISEEFNTGLRTRCSICETAFPIKAEGSYGSYCPACHTAFKLQQAEKRLAELSLAAPAGEPRVMRRATMRHPPCAIECRCDGNQVYACIGNPSKALVGESGVIAFGDTLPDALRALALEIEREVEPRAEASAPAGDATPPAEPLEAKE